MSRIFGKLPSGGRLARVRASPQYKNGKFSNQSFTPDLSEDATMWKVLKAYRKKPATVRPPFPIPAKKPDFANLPRMSRPLSGWAIRHTFCVLKA